MQHLYSRGISVQTSIEQKELVDTYVDKGTCRYIIHTYVDIAMSGEMSHCSTPSQDNDNNEYT